MIVHRLRLERLIWPPNQTASLGVSSEVQPSNVRCDSVDNNIIIIIIIIIICRLVMICETAADVVRYSQSL